MTQISITKKLPVEATKNLKQKLSRTSIRRRKRGAVAILGSWDRLELFKSRLQRRQATIAEEERGGELRPSLARLISALASSISRKSRHCSLSFIKKAHNHDNHYIVHDLLYEMAESVSNGEQFRIEDDFHVSIPRNVRHLYVNATNISKVCMSLVESQDLKKNLSLIICKHDAPSGERIPPDNFNKVLKETLYGILPDNIEHLVHLRYLDISQSRRFTSIPKSLFRLYHLQGFIPQSHCQHNIQKEQKKHISKVTADPVKILGSIWNFRHQNDR
uniref:Uncharacterized protein n=1 Tax=Setaria italica TaxID=4555 RepID=K3YE72_SETIT